MPPRVHHISFATKEFLESEVRLRRSAAAFGLETKFFHPTSAELGPLRETSSDILAATRGAGFWLWKPFIIYETLKTAAAGDIVVYTDAGVEIISPLRPLIDLANENEVVLFRTTDHRLRHWTKRDAFVLMSADEESYWDAPVLTAGYQLYRVGPASTGFVKEWLTACCDRRILTDDPNTCGLPNLEDFKDHRHDQSALSIVTRRHSIGTFVDPSQYGVFPPDYRYGQIFNHHRKRTASSLKRLKARFILATGLWRRVR
jgi:hypothetical protein